MAIHLVYIEGKWRPEPISGPPAEGHAPAVEGSVPGNDHDAGGARFTGEEGCVQSAGDEGSAPGDVLAEHTADEDSSLADSGCDRDRAVVVGVALRANDCEKKGDKGRDVWQAGRVVLYTAAQGGELRERCLAAGENIFQESRQLGFLFGGNGERAMDGVHNHSGVGDALRRELALVVTEAKAELGRQAMPVVLGASGLAAKVRAESRSDPRCGGSAYKPSSVG
jgi:hypothetical protein